VERRDGGRVEKRLMMKEEREKGKESKTENRHYQLGGKNPPPFPSNEKRKCF
jgi:hypothetical protein